MKTIKPLYCIIFSIGCGWISVLCFVASLEISVFFSIGWFLFSFTALFLGLVSVWKTFKGKKIMNAIIELCALLLLGLLICGIVLGQFSRYRLLRAIDASELTVVKDVNNFIKEYSSETGHMPDVNNWCDLLIHKHIRFDIKQIGKVECKFAFNDKICNSLVKTLDNNVILFFVADGKWNQIGGPELINKPRAQDRYFLFKSRIFIYILFVDGTITKYRLHDGAIAKYDPQKDEFGPYIEKGKTPYSPFRWK